MWGTCVQMDTKYEVSTSNHVPGGRCAQTMTPMPLHDDANNDDGQFMIVLGSLVQISQKISNRF